MNPIAIRPARDRRGEIGSEPNGAGNGFKTDPRTRADDLPRKRKRRFRGDRHLYLRFRRFSIADRTRPIHLIPNRFDHRRRHNHPGRSSPHSIESRRPFHKISEYCISVSRNPLKIKLSRIPNPPPIIFEKAAKRVLQFDCAVVSLRDIDRSTCFRHVMKITAIDRVSANSPLRPRVVLWFVLNRG